MLNFPHLHLYCALFMVKHGPNLNPLSYDVCVFLYFGHIDFKNGNIKLQFVHSFTLTELNNE